MPISKNAYNLVPAVTARRSGRRTVWLTHFGFENSYVKITAGPRLQLQHFDQALVALADALVRSAHRKLWVEVGPRPRRSHWRCANISRFLARRGTLIVSAEPPPLSSSAAAQDTGHARAPDDIGASGLAERHGRIFGFFFSTHTRSTRLCRRQSSPGFRLLVFRLLIDKPSVYVRVPGHDMPEPISYLSRVRRCGLLVDINNVFVSASNWDSAPKLYRLASGSGDWGGEILLQVIPSKWRIPRSLHLFSLEMAPEDTTSCLA